jgi:hypothetical protein
MLQRYLCGNDSIQGLRHPGSHQAESIAPQTFESLPSIISAPCAMAVSSIDRDHFKQLLADARCSVAFGQPCSQFLMQGVQEAIRGIQTGWYTMIEVGEDNVHHELSAWFRSKPFGDISPTLEHALQQDIENDVIGFTRAIEAPRVTLRLVLDTSSGFEELWSVLPNSSPEALGAYIDSVVSKLEYDKAYLFHTDEDVVNQLKSYAGATTLGIDPCDISSHPSLDNWFAIFHGKDSLRELAAEAISRDDALLLSDAIRVAVERAWSYQLDLPGLVQSGATPYRFLVGAPHLYFGAPEKLAPLGHQLPKSALHAKPLIWATEPSAKRFLTILDSPRDYNIQAQV